jgi:1-acyl-sn-glycerol-3-phosphate acyltransferase
MKGIQGWFLHRLGCFPVNQLKPQTASLRFAVDLLEAGQQLVVFPEGRIMREPGPIRLMQGLSRLALLASAHGLDVPVLPIGIAYGRAVPRLGDSAALAFGPPLHVQGHGREAAKHFSEQLAAAMAAAEARALAVVGRSAAEGGFAAPVEFSNV